MLTNKDSEAIEALDLTPIKIKLMHGESGEGWKQAKADAVEAEYRRFLYLVKKYPNEQFAPTVDVDVFWHYHILDTMKYAQDCEELFGYFLHHDPNLGLGEDSSPDDQARAGQRMHDLYEAEFGDEKTAAARRAGSAWCTVTTTDFKTAWCTASSPEATTAWCTVTDSQARSAWCTVAAPKAKTAWCTVTAPQVRSAWCTVTAPKAKTAWCTVTAPQANSAWCTVTTPKARTAWCTFAAPRPNSAWCTRALPAAEAAWCTVAKKIGKQIDVETPLLLAA
ncbi:glycine-rich domain-containing protein-like [Massilia solisilvae]|uniref:Glycine-rich domain-containing protein-like n=1 Tax=Massilia solisilvae TaxID=1811225 RepID=A0ABT2BIU9_9BURK|nr:glycine-rich domain-containing protein-like [Massilia solisilvae]MCS0608443.1 glycine-rich domain-containing protein-like [Massilia solisilvae]